MTEEVYYYVEGNESIGNSFAAVPPYRTEGG